MIIERLVVGPIEANCYIIGDEASKEGLVIDPGADGKMIIKRVAELGLNIKYIILTHSHFDHVLATAAVKDASGALLAVHKSDSSTLNDGLLARLAGIVTEKVPEPEILLGGWDNLSIGNLTFTVIHTPGHTPGGIALYGQDVIFTGDTMFQTGIGRTDLPGGNYEQIMDSINSRLMVLDDEIKVYPGHGPDTTIGDERRGNPFLVNPPRRNC